MSTIGVVPPPESPLAGSPMVIREAEFWHIDVRLLYLHGSGILWHWRRPAFLFIEVIRSIISDVAVMIREGRVHHGVEFICRCPSVDSRWEEWVTLWSDWQR
jgi:hypothetical protein